MTDFPITVSPYQTWKLHNGETKPPKWFIEYCERLKKYYDKELEMADNRWKSNEKYRDKYMEAYQEGFVEGEKILPYDVSEWKKIGEERGYSKFFEEKIRKETIERAIELTQNMDSFEEYIEWLEKELENNL